MSERTRVRFKSEAERDLKEAFEWYQGRRRGLGDEFLLAVEACIQLIGRTPLVFPEICMLGVVPIEVDAWFARAQMRDTAQLIGDLLGAGGSGGVGPR